MSTLVIFPVDWFPTAYNFLFWSRVYLLEMTMRGAIHSRAIITIDTTSQLLEQWI